MDSRKLKFFNERPATNKIKRKQKCVSFIDEIDKQESEEKKNCRKTVCYNCNGYGHWSNNCLLISYDRANLS